MKYSPSTQTTAGGFLLLFTSMIGVMHAQLPSNPNYQYYDLDGAQVGASELYGVDDGSDSFLANMQNEYFHASISAGVRYDDNIFLTAENEVDDVIWSVTPSFVLNNGGAEASRHTFELRYTPSFQFYVDNGDRDTINQFVGFYYGLNLAKTRVRAALSYSDTNGSNRFTSGTVDEQLLNASISVNHILSEKTRLDVSAGARVNVFDSSSLFDTEEYSFRVGLAYAYSPKLNLGVDAGYVEDGVDNGLDQDAVDIGLSATYKYSPKTSVTGRVGYGVRSFEDGFDDLDEPVWSLSASHEATAKTRVYGKIGQNLETYSSGVDDSTDITWSLGGSHRVSDYTSLNGAVYRTSNPSNNIANAGYVATGVRFGLNHQITARTSAGFSAAFENDDYFESSGGDVNLDNDYYILRLNLRHQFGNGIALNAFTRWQEQDSNQSSNDFSNFSFGLNASYNLW